MKYQASFLLSSLLAFGASLGVSLTASEAHAQACSARTKVMFCGNTNRAKADIFTNTAGYTFVNGCAPDADTKALMISRNGAINGPVFKAYLDAGGVVITEFNQATPVYNAIYGTNIAPGSFVGSCQDNSMPSHKFNPTHPFWLANNLAVIPTSQDGCGMDLRGIVAADPLVTPLGGWASVSGSVSLAVRPQANGLLYLLESDWQDNEQGPTFNVQESRDVLGGMIDSCGTCASNAECGAAEVCDLVSSNQCEPINTCGNGTVEAGEACDDGEQVDGDGCSSTCLIEIGGSCTNSNQCGTGLCDGNICACNDNNDCSMGYVCDTAMSPNSCEPAINYSTTIDQPIDGVLLNTDTLVISGTTEANASVEVTIDGQVASVVTANAAGQWSYTASNIAEGAHTTSVIATDGLGNDAPAGPVSFNIDTIAPAPTIAVPVAGANLTDNTPTISGTTEALATVVVSVDGQVAGTVTANAQGAWTYTSASLADGAHNVSVTSTDAAGNSGSAGPVSFSIDTVAPAPVIAAPVAGANLTDNTPTISGTTEALASVVIRVDGQVVGTVTASAAGAWTYTSASLADGAHNVSVTSTDAAGNSGSAGPVSFNIDTMAPAPAIAAPVANANLNTATPVISGTTEALASVVIRVDGQVVGTVTANAQGAWTYTSASLADGAHTTSVTSTDAAGNSGSAGPVSFNVDTVAPAPAIAAPVADANLTDNTPTISGTTEALATVVVSVDGQVAGTVTANAQGAWTYTSASLADGAHNVSVTSTDAAGNSGSAGPVSFSIDTVAPAPVIAAPVAGANLTDNTPTISGTTEALASVVIRVDGQVVGTVTASAQGAWTYTSASLADGAHTTSVTSTDAAGNSGSAGPVSFNIDTVAPAPVISVPADDANLVVNTPVISGTSEAGSDVVISVDGQVVATVTTSAAGAWTYTSALLADGAHTTSVTSTDAAGNSGAAGPVSFSIDTMAPAPAIAMPVADANLNTATPVISGTTEAGALVEISVDGQVVGTVTASAAGAWTYTSASLAEGAHNVSVTSTDAAGNSGSAGPVSFNIDTIAPAPLIAAPVADANLATNTPVISGTSEAGSDVVISVDGQVVATLAADANGDWTYTSAMLAEGAHTTSVTSTDAASNSGSAGPVSFNVDTVVPVPTVVNPALDSYTSNTMPLISGTSENDAAVSVRLLDAAGTELESFTTTADVASGAWMAQVTVALVDGAYTIEVTSTDAAGNSGSVTSSFNVDSTVLAVDVTTPTLGQMLNVVRPEIAGTTAADVMVTVLIKDAQGADVETLTTTADANGDWSVTPTQDLVDGEYTAEAIVANFAGLESSDTTGFTVDTMAPSVTLTSPADGEQVDTTTPTFSGTSEPGATVTVVLTNAAGEIVETLNTTADANGDWSIPAQALPEGGVTVVVTSTDAAGNETTLPGITINVDATAPTTAITSPTEGQVFTDAQPTITGTSDAGASVEISVDGQIVNTVTAGADGSWSLALDAALADGEHTVSATGTDAAGNSSASQTVNFVVDTTPPAVAITSPVTGDAFDKLPITITGTSEPGASVEVIINGETVATVTADEAGEWSYDVTTLPNGEFTLKAKATDANGLSQESQELTLSLSIDTSTPVVVEGGCGCGSAQGSSPAGSLLLLTLAMGFGWFRRRRR